MGKILISLDDETEKSSGPSQSSFLEIKEGLLALLVSWRSGNGMFEMIIR